MQRATTQRFFTFDELRNWSVTREQIGHRLKKHYRACTTEELPPRLRKVLKKLDEEKSEVSGSGNLLTLLDVRRRPRKII
jgi:predicted metal-dependent hydrolase